MWLACSELHVPTAKRIHFYNNLRMSLLTVMGWVGVPHIIYFVYIVQNENTQGGNVVNREHCIFVRHNTCYVRSPYTICSSKNQCFVIKSYQHRVQNSL